LSGQAITEDSNPSGTTFQQQPRFNDLPTQANSNGLDPETIVTVKIDGVEKQIPLREALSGYAAHSKVTQVTQEMAAYKVKAKQLDTFVDHLNSDPHGMLQDLAGKLKVKVEFPGSANASEPDDDYPDEVSAEVALANERRIAALEAAMTSQAQISETEKTISRLQAEHGDAFRPEATMAYATAHPGLSLEQAHKLMMYESGGAVAPPVSDATANADILSGIAPGSPTNQGAPPVPERAAPESVRDAFTRAAALEGIQIGV
jgi:hypothetical protein